MRSGPPRCDIVAVSTGRRTGWARENMSVAGRLGREVRNCAGKPRTLMRHRSPVLCAGPKAAAALRVRVDAVVLRRAGHRPVRRETHTSPGGGQAVSSVSVGASPGTGTRSTSPHPTFPTSAMIVSTVHCAADGHMCLPRYMLWACAARKVQGLLTRERHTLDQIRSEFMFRFAVYPAVSV
jgi:hypothetical protein